MIFLRASSANLSHRTRQSLAQLRERALVRSCASCTRWWRTLVLVVCIALSPSTGRPHDPSAWGGLFRSRDGGATWLAVDAGSFVSGAVGLAISPVTSTHLLLAVESGVLASENGGRDWTVQAPDVLVGAAFAAAYDADGARALVSGASALFKRDGGRWQPVRAPAGATPARALARGSVAGRVYLAGWSGFYRSDDWGTSWADASDGLGPDPIEVVVVGAGPPEVVYAIAGGRLWASDDGALRWRPCDTGSPSARAVAVALDDADGARVWALANGQLFRSDDRGARWVPIGRPLPDPQPRVRGLVVLGPTVLLTTDQGLYRSPNGGERWDLHTDNLPAHLEAGPLVRDPALPATVYAGFAFTPYAELWRRAAEGGSPLLRLDATALAGAGAFLALLVLCSVAAIRRLRASHYRTPFLAPPATAARGQRVR